MVKDVAVQGEGGVALAVARMTDSVQAEWQRGRQRWQSRWSRRDEPVAKESLLPPNAAELLVRMDPLVAVRWRGSW
ncbi:hypothetical protein [Nocardia sp. CS682]|uniref:hypothetical protein n=1 Tax=Nocardia sp. CS682 TaxID=1047172 RepID=UPI001075215F|nr:hypothetical protein [Nocardia sp. CS682]QBS40700.1 hypothetical protein DMB37_11800 [Nocardia sp. CS682]